MDREDIQNLEEPQGYLDASYAPVEEDYDMRRENVKKYLEEFLTNHPTVKRQMVPYVEKNLLGKFNAWGAAGNILIEADESGHMNKIAEHWHSQFLAMLRWVLKTQFHFIIDKETGQITGVDSDKIKRIK